VTEASVPVLTNQNDLISKTLTTQTQTQSLSLVQTITEPLMEQIQIDVQENLIQTVGSKLDKLEHVSTSSIGTIVESVLEVGTAAIGATAGAISIGLTKELAEKEITMKKNYDTKVAENLLLPEENQTVIKDFVGPSLDNGYSYAALTGITVLSFSVVCFVCILLYSYNIYKLEKSQNILIEKYNEQSNMLNQQIQKDCIIREANLKR